LALTGRSKIVVDSEDKLQGSVWKLGQIVEKYKTNISARNKKVTVFARAGPGETNVAAN
jgi:hypothetical protein